MDDYHLFNSIVCEGLKKMSDAQFFLLSSKQKPMPGMSLLKWNLLFLIVIQISYINCLVNPSTLQCYKRLYTFKVTQEDENGKQCWDTLSVMSCWGRCDSNEVSDWRFPHYKSHHPVCIHSGRTKLVAKLRHCEAGVIPGTEIYEFMEAESCRCQICSSTNTSCEGLKYNSLASDTGFLDLSNSNNIGEFNDIK